MNESTKPKLYDAFICHASEDKDDFVRPLAELLRQQHVDVWYDEFSLSLGDSLTQKIDEGLAKARFGIVVISPSFFRKPWAKRELNGLTAREMFEKQDVILPIWHRVGASDVIEFSSPLADKKAVLTSGGINAVLRDLIKRIKPEESPLVVARDNLVAHKFDPPPVSDEWWLDVVEYKEFLKFPDTNVGKRWIFPLPFPDENRGRERGLNIASTALQMDWSFEGEELNISPVTHPDKVHEFLRRWPGLIDCARENPAILALYAPQLTIPGFDTGFEDVFDVLLETGNPDADIIFSYSPHNTNDGKEPLCGDVIAYRHPDFGNYTAAELAHWYFSAHTHSYIRSHHNCFDGLVWLISNDASWLPPGHRSTLIRGITDRGQWVRDSLNHGSDNPFLDALLEKTRKQFKFTSTIRSGLLQLIDVARLNTGVSQASGEIAQALIDIDIVKGFYDYQDYFKALRAG